MAADVIVSRELQSLQKELSATRRTSMTAPENASGSAAAAAEPPKESADEGDLRDQLRELAAEVTRFFEEAESTVSAHPAQSVIGAMLVGILIGRLLGRR
jgi:ElaB/YqjD/DUF883 family membrane-anchored ribosome-binding protein